MNKRPNVHPEPRPPSNLLISRKEATEQLSKRIAIGNEFLLIPINSNEDYKTVNENYSLWHTFNIELLRRMFDTNEFSSEYSFWGAAFLGSDYLPDKIKDLHEDIQKYIHRLISIKERLPLIPEIPSIIGAPESHTVNVSSIKNNDVFIVHGRDHGAKETVARFLNKLKLNSIILHEQPNLGDTVIEKLERNSEVSFAIILLTPDDKGGPNLDNTPSSLRARQNVVLEFGYFIGKLGRNKVCAIYSDGVELPSDVHGLLYIQLDPGGAWQLSLAKELRSAGFNIDLNEL